MMDRATTHTQDTPRQRLRLNCPASRQQLERAPPNILSPPPTPLRCYPGAPVHVWMHNVRYGCFCTLEGILNLTDCTPEWFSIRKGRSVPSRLQYQLKDLHDP